MELAQESVDDGYTVSILMDLCTAGAELVEAVAENRVKAVVVWNGERIGKDQPIFWQFIGLCHAKSTAPDEPVPQSSMKILVTVPQMLLTKLYNSNIHYVQHLHSPQS
jgi:hypothetical protein